MAGRMIQQKQHLLAVDLCVEVPQPSAKDGSLHSRSLVPEVVEGEVLDVDAFEAPWALQFVDKNEAQLLTVIHVTAKIDRNSCLVLLVASKWLGCEGLAWEQTTVERCFVEVEHVSGVKLVGDLSKILSMAGKRAEVN